MKRRICWPGPTLHCLAGTCANCNRYHFRPVTQIEAWARRRGKPWLDAHEKGKANYWPSADVKDIE